MQIRIAPDPQLVVCKGNVADRVQKLKTGQSVLGWRCSRSSYGTMCKMLYEPQNPQHFGLRTECDRMDGKIYVTNCIDWFIKQASFPSSLRRSDSLTCASGRARIKRPPYCAYLWSQMCARHSGGSNPKSDLSNRSRVQRRRQISASGGSQSL